MRHGAAEDRSLTGRDSDRALTPAGRAAVHRVAVALRAATTGPIEQILSSPLLRAQQTAEIVRAVLCPQVDIETDDDLTPDAAAYDLAVRVASQARSTLLVFHQPNIEMVARALAASPSRPSSRDGAAGGPKPQRAGRASGGHAAASAKPALHLPHGFRTASVVGFHVAARRPPPFQLALSLEPDG
jgi:phosphohistidine phosphatase